MRIWGVCVVGIICFYAGFFIASLMAARKLGEWDRERDAEAPPEEK